MDRKLARPKRGAKDQKEKGRISWRIFFTDVDVIVDQLRKKTWGLFQIQSSNQLKKKTCGWFEEWKAHLTGLASSPARPPAPISVRSIWQFENVEIISHFLSEVDNHDHLYPLLNICFAKFTCNDHFSRAPTCAGAPTPAHWNDHYKEDDDDDDISYKCMYETANTWEVDLSSPFRPLQLSCWCLHQKSEQIHLNKKLNNKFS